MKIPGLRRPGAGSRSEARPVWPWWRRLTASQFLVISFLVLIVVGTLGLRLLPGFYVDQRLGWIDALFTATSAVCVTGLIVVDTATFFTPAGQAFILVLIQLGGLGILTFGTLIMLALGRKLSLRQEAVSASLADVAPYIDFRHLTRNVLLFAVAFELLGALVLTLAWLPGLGFREAAWHAVFHAVSAFCNAGFSTFSNSMVQYQADSFTLLSVALLVIVGGIGFLTMEELYLRGSVHRLWRRRASDPIVPRLSLHSRLVLATTAILIFGAALFFSAYEWNLSFADMSVGDRLVNGFFISAASRTAGFNAIDHAEAADGTNFLVILLMFIGGAPGSTAGGVKLTTVAVIGLLALARLRGQYKASLLGRTIPDETIQRAVGLVVVAFGLVTIAIFLLTTTEIGTVPHHDSANDFLRYMFEAVSAFATTGLSMGVTGELSEPGRLIVSLLMYLGRIGPLTFAAAIALRPAVVNRQLRYAYEDVMIG